MASITLSRLALLPLALVACTFEAGGLGGEDSGGDSDSTSSGGNSTTAVDPTTAGPTASGTDPGTGTGTSVTEATTTPVTTTDPSSTTADPSSTTDAPGVCGDGTVDVGEECDAGAMNGDDQACTLGCKNNVCGDGKPGPGEGCDDGNVMPNDGCSPQCTAESCGDAVVQPNEECDDGNQTNDDDCTNACTKPACGDKIVQAGEQCDDGAESATCDADCSNATCGDGTLNMTAGEVCDDDNDANTDACAACKPAKCGDGFVQTNVEACDDGNQVDNDGCSNACTIIGLRVFVSSALYNGNLGGLGGADAKCNSLAVNAGLGGTWMAWLSASLTGPSERFTTKGGQKAYVRLDGKLVANNWADLTTKNLVLNIDINENKQMPADTTRVWTNTKPDGTPASLDKNCALWVSGSGNVSGIFGRRSMLDSKWTQDNEEGCQTSSLRKAATCSGGADSAKLVNATTSANRTLTVRRWPPRARACSPAAIERATSAGRKRERSASTAARRWISRSPAAS